MAVVLPCWTVKVTLLAKLNLIIKHAGLEVYAKMQPTDVPKYKKLKLTSLQF